MENKENNFLAISLSNTPRDPSISTQPIFTETRNRGGWIQFGTDNLAPQKINEWLNRSSRHSSIVKDKAMMIGGGGFEKEGLSPKAITFLNNINSVYGDTLDDILYKISFDLELYGAITLNPIWSRDKSRGLGSIEYLDTAKVRIASPDYGAAPDDIDGYYISHDWSKIREFKPTFIERFTNSGSGSQLIYEKDHRTNTYYGEPEYASGFNWIEADWRISRFHNQSLKNGFSPNAAINFPQGVPSFDEMEKFIRKFKDEYFGEENVSKTLFTFSPTPETAPQVQILNSNNSDTKYIDLTTVVREGILAAHRIKTPVLFGVEVAGKLGSRNELLEALSIFQSSYIEPKQKRLEIIFNKLARLNGVTDELKIKKYKIDFSKIEINMKELSDVLSGTLLPEQKYYILTSSGYTDDLSRKLSGYSPE